MPQAALPPRRRLKPPTPERLANIALYYLGRYAASEASLRRVLENRLRRAVMQDPALAEDDQKMASLREAITHIIEKHRRTGVLNDAAYAEMKTRSLRRAGGSRRVIEEKLKMKGIRVEQTARALAATDEENGTDDGEQAAALAFARKKRLGVFSPKPDDPDRRRKNIAAMARAGFSSAVAFNALRGEVET